MNTYLVAAGTLAFLVGLVHSVLGEVLLFRRLRQGGLIPTAGAPLLEERHVRILWATWHVVTVLGWCLAAVLVWLSLHDSQRVDFLFVKHAIVAATLTSSALVLVGTKARHPGWLGLLCVAALVGLDAAAQPHMRP